MVSFFVLIWVLVFAFYSSGCSASFLRKLDSVGPLTNDDLQNTKLHICSDKGETFSGSFLITKGRLLNKKIDYNLKDVSCEFAVDMMISSTKKIFQTTDVLDLSVINLSLYERLLMQRNKDVTAAIKLNETENIGRAAEHIRMDTLTKRIVTPTRQTLLPDNLYSQATVVVMPVLLSARGSSFSKNENRKRYLNASFYSFYANYNKIVCFVMNDEDYQYVKFQSGLPFWEVVLLKDLPTYASLPVASMQYTQKMIRDNTWAFRYVFYTEADQILLMRNPPDVYQYLEKYPKYFVSPHRLTVFPDKILTQEFGRQINTVPVKDWKQLSCCIPRQDCSSRVGWTSIANSTAGPSLLNLYGLQVALGNSNFHTGDYRTCAMSGYRAVCPP